ncbi:MAG: hypothetical protein AB9873_11005 [Syntrophobacteraceae bacterium]
MKKYKSFFVISVICLLFVVFLFLTKWAALTIGLIILGGFNYLEKIFNIEITKESRIALLVGFIILSASNILYNYHKEYSTNRKVQQAEQASAEANKRAAELENKTAQAQLELQKLKDKQAPWVLTSDQETMLKQLLENAKKGKIEMAYYLPDGERAGAFARKLETIFKDSGYDMAPEIAMVTNTSNPTGIYIFYRKDEDRNRTIEYTAILGKIGLLCKFEKIGKNHVDLWPGLDNAVTITVYNKPQNN